MSAQGIGPKILMPHLLPLLEPSTLKPVTYAYRLVFLDQLIVYYSYQYPLAFYDQRKLTVRSDFWNRERGKRAIQKKAICLDAERMYRMTPLPMSEETDKWFFDSLYQAMALLATPVEPVDIKPGANPSAAPAAMPLLPLPTAPAGAGGRRRVIL